MLLQTNSYIVPKERRPEHARLLRRFRQTLLRLGCDHFEVYEQVGPNWTTGESTGRYVQIMRFRDRQHQLQVQAAERADQAAQQLIAEFCQLINFPYQQQQGLFAVGFYTSALPVGPVRPGPEGGDAAGTEGVSGQEQSPEGYAPEGTATPEAVAPQHEEGISLADEGGGPGAVPGGADSYEHQQQPELRGADPRLDEMELADDLLEPGDEGSGNGHLLPDLEELPGVPPHSPDDRPPPLRDRGRVPH